MKKIFRVISLFLMSLNSFSQNNICFSGVDDYKTIIGNLNGLYRLDVNDFNNDGKKDVLSMSYYPNFYINLGNGDGSFNTATQYTTNGTCFAITSGDINADNLNDIIVATNTNVLNVYQNLGSGSFTLVSTFTVGNSIPKIQLKQMNQDAFPDLVIADDSGNNAYISLGNGTFSYSNFIQLPCLSGQKDFVIADLNNDSQNDVAFLCNNVISAFHLNTNASVANALTFNYSGIYETINAGDFNNDNLQDIILSSYSNNVINLIINNGLNSGWTSIQKNIQHNAEALVVGDFDSNGFSDIATGQTLSDVISVNTFTNNCNFKISKEYNTDYTLCSGIFHLQKSDVNNDGILDIVGLCFGGRFYTLLGRGDGTFYGNEKHIGYAILQRGLVANLNNDSQPDIIKYNSSSVGTIVTTLKNGNNFDSISSITVTNGFYSICSKDLNGDNFDDLIICKDDPTYTAFELKIYQGLGNGIFSLVNTLQGGPGGPRILIVKDLDNDNKPEIFASYEHNNTNFVGYYIFKNNGNFSFNNAIYTQLSHTNIKFADINSDGKQDFVTLGGGPNVNQSEVYFGNGNLSFSLASSMTINFASNFSAFELKDINYDNNLDLIINNSTSGIDVYTGSSNGSFVYGYNIQNTGMLMTNLLDLNNDNKLDIVNNVFGWGGMSTREGLSALQFSTPNHFYINKHVWSAEFVDFNNDSLLDLFTSDGAMCNFDIHYNTSAVIKPLTATPLCQGSNINLEARTKDGYHYKWNPGSVSSQSININSTNNYSLSIKNISGSCNSNSTYSVTFSICTDIKTNDNVNNISVYPSVTNDVFYINKGSDGVFEDIRILNISGQTVYQAKNYSEEIASFSLKEKANGMYFVTIRTQNKNYSFKVIKTN
jgi:hypothetical protein